MLAQSAEHMNELRISTHTSEGSVVSIIRRDQSQPSFWFSLADTLYYINKPASESAMQKVAEHLAPSQIRIGEKEYWLSREGLLKVPPF